MNSSNYMDGIIPGASITVYLTGTTTKATIYADGSNTPLSNPFFSNLAPGTNPGGFIFWAAQNQGLDIQAQGGMGNASCTTSPLCYPTATTLQVDVYPNNSFSLLPINCTGTGSSQVCTFSGTVQAATITDGTASLHSGALTGTSASFSGAVTGASFNGVPLTTSDASTLFLNGAGTYTVPAGGGGGTVNAGTAGQFAQYISAGTAVSGVSPAIALSSMNGVGPVANVTNPIYGGECDGVTDDTAAIQLAANTGMTVFLPWDGIPGHYCKISGTISLTFFGQSIIGSSKKYGGLGEVTPNTDAIHLGGSANNDNLGVYNLQVFYAGPSASGLVLTSTISGSTVTAITVSSGGTNFYAPPNIGVNGCWNVSTTATIPTLGGPISAVTVSAGGTCIPQTNVWAASMVVPGNWSFIDGNGYIEMAGFRGGTAGSTEPTFTTVYGSTQTDGTITWTNEGLYGAVAWNGGSTSGVGAYVHPSGTTESDFFTVNSAYFNGFSTGIYFSGSGNARLWNVSTSSDSSSGAGIYTTGGATNSFVGIGINNRGGSSSNPRNRT